MGNLRKQLRSLRNLKPFSNLYNHRKYPDDPWKSPWKWLANSHNCFNTKSNLQKCFNLKVQVLSFLGTAVTFFSIARLQIWSGRLPKIRIPRIYRNMVFFLSCIFSLGEEGEELKLFSRLNSCYHDLSFRSRELKSWLGFYGLGVCRGRLLPETGRQD